MPRRKFSGSRAVKPAELYKLLKSGEAPDVYVLCGDELYNHYLAISHIVRHLKEKGYEPRVVFADELNDVEAVGGGLFSSGIVYVIKGVRGRTKDKVKNFVERMAGLGDVVSVVDMEPEEKRPIALGIPHIVVDCKKLSLKEARKILKALIERLGKKVTAGALDLMLSATDGYIYPVLTDLKKLRLLDGNVVDERVVSEYFALPWEPNIFVFWDSLWSGDTSYVKRFRDASLLSGNPPAVLMATMASFLRATLEVGMLLDEGLDVKSIAREVGRKPFYVSKLARLYRKIGRKAISDLIWALYELDLKVKTGEITDAEALDYFVAKIVALMGNGLGSAM